MDPRLLGYYNDELLYMRELAGEFAQAHPKIARRLGMQAGEVADPYVERLIESFCFMSARVQLRLDAEFPRFTGRLLEVLYPNYVAPTPSIAVARLYPGNNEGNLTEGFRVARGATFSARIPDGERTACRFRSGQEVVLYPLDIVDARLTGVPADLPALDRYLPDHVQVRGALRLRVRTLNGARIADLRGLDRLPVFLPGDEQVASQLFELLHAASVASIVGVPGQLGANSARSVPPHIITSDAVVHDSLGVDQGLLPLRWPRFHGHNLLHEYFACPARFHFFTLTGLEAGLRQIEGDEAEIVVLLTRPAERLAHVVDASRFALFCTPVINLFRMRTDPIELAADHTEYRIVPQRLAPRDYEVYAVANAYGKMAAQSDEVEFRPFYETLNRDAGNHGRYFSLRRERSLSADAAYRSGMQAPYAGTDTWLSLVDQHEAPYRAAMRYLSLDAWLTNRDLAALVPRDGVHDLTLVEESAPLASIGLIQPPSAPRAPYAERESAWRLIRQLNFDHLPLDNLDHRVGGAGVRDLLRLFIDADDARQQRLVDSLIGVRTRAVMRKLPGNGPLVFGRGIECALTVDEIALSGASPYLFGLVVEHYLARHVSINAFTQTELHSIQRGMLARWPVRMGTRGAV